MNGVRWHQCPYCTKEFKKPSDLVRHIRIHTHEKPYKCTQCFRAFAVKSTLTAHIKTHLGVKDYKCEECNKLFSTQGSLKVHLRLHTGVWAIFLKELFLTVNKQLWLFFFFYLVFLRVCCLFYLFFSDFFCHRPTFCAVSCQISDYEMTVKISRLHYLGKRAVVYQQGYLVGTVTVFWGAMCCILQTNSC